MKYGFIGCGNMGGAVARAVCKGAGSGDVLLANRTPAKAQALADELGCACGTNEEVAGTHGEPSDTSPLALRFL